MNTPAMRAALGANPDDMDTEGLEKLAEIAELYTAKIGARAAGRRLNMDDSDSDEPPPAPPAVAAGPWQPPATGAPGVCWAPAGDVA